MKTLFILIALSGLFFPSFGQKSKVAYIMEKYLEVKDKIGQNEIYKSTYQINAGNLSWNTTLQYRKNENYFFSVAQDTHTFLHLITIEVDSAQNHYDIEYLYNREGQLLYCLEQQKESSISYQDFKAYFEKGELIQIWEGNIGIQSSTIFHSQKVKYIQESARLYWNKFQVYMKSLPGTQ